MNWGENNRVDHFAVCHSAGCYTHANPVNPVIVSSTSYVYDQHGRQIETIDALNQSTHTVYDLRGNVIRQYGTTYPVWYEYDADGRKVAMATTRDTALDPATVDSLDHPSLDVTRWNYDPATGLLVQKRYGGGRGLGLVACEGCATAILNMAAFHWRRRARRARPTLRTHDLRGFSGAISGRAVSWVPGHIANCWGLGCSQPQLLTTLVASRSWQDEDTATAARSSFGRCVTESLVSSSAAPWTNAEIRDAGWRAREDHVMGCFLRPSPSIPLPPSSRAQVD